jgi:cbb3-type cytochrome c oxidase subunit III|tara:strand:+ start:2757 stop:3476 length:720 start_codon:yes stop_codon:yes gene_type:complete
MKIKTLISIVITLLSISLVHGTSFESGQSLYGSNCVGCHGLDGKGTPNVFPALNNQNFLKLNDDEQIKSIIVNGKAGTGMIAWSETKGGVLTNSQIDDIVLFIRNWEIKEVIQDSTENSVVDKEKVQITREDIYNTNCVGCHGEEGVGTQSGPSLIDNEFVSISNSEELKAVIYEGRVEKGMPSWKGILSNEQIDSLVPLLKSWKQEEIGVHVSQWYIGLIAFGLLFIIMALTFIYKNT